MNHMEKTESEQAENHFSFIEAFENASTGLAFMSLEGVWLKVNAALLEILGYSREELRGLTFNDITVPEDRADSIAGLGDLMAGRISEFSREKRYVCKNGVVVWVSINATMLRDPAGAPNYIFSQIQNVSSRKLAEISLRDNDIFLRSLVESIPQIIWITMPDGSGAYVNHRWVDYTGMKLEEGSGIGWERVFHPNEIDHVKMAWKSALENGANYSVECRLRRADGIYFWWLIRGAPVIDPAGKILKWVGTCTDIDELKKTFARAKIAEDSVVELEGMINQAKDAIVVKDLDDVIRFWNHGAERIYGWSAQEAIGRRSTGLYAPDLGRHEECVRHLFRDGHWEGESVHMTKNGASLTVESRWTLNKDSLGRPKSILSINSDVTEKKKNQAQSFRAQRMESIGTLAGGIAHDLNNVLTPIMMSIEFLIANETNKDRLETLETIDACSRRGADMVKQVLSYARGVEGARMELNPGKIVKDIEKIAGETFLKAIEIKTSLDPKLRNILGDATQLHQVLLNLCVNARDAMAKGGVLTLGAENVTLLEQASSAAHDGCKAGDYVMLSVEDSGAGIPPEILERIFEPFFTTKELGKGTGLGLSTSIAIVRSHGGCIRVYSEVGRGTKFVVYLPVNCDSVAKEEMQLPDQLLRGEGELILVVDDEATLLKITKQILEAFGYRVITANCGVDAVSIYREQGKNIAAVITDMMMPQMDGAEIVKEIKRLSPSAKVIAASGLMLNATSIAADHFLSKPYSTKTLLNALFQTLHSAKRVK